DPARRAPVAGDVARPPQACERRWRRRAPGGGHPGGTLDLGAALAAHAPRHPAAGAALVISDFMMDPAHVGRGVFALRGGRWEVVLLQVVGAHELEPDFRGGVLMDVESGATHPVAVTETNRCRYQALVANHLAALHAVAARHRAVYARLVAGESV